MYLTCQEWRRQSQEKYSKKSDKAMPRDVFVQHYMNGNDIALDQAGALL